MTAPPVLLIVLGPQASGISSALSILDDLNVPQWVNAPVNQLQQPESLTPWVESVAQAPAAAMTFNFDNINALNADDIINQLEALKVTYPQIKTLFLSAPDEILAQRRNLAKKNYSSVDPAVEKKFYDTLKAVKDYSIDTSTLTLEELRFKLCKILDMPETLDKMSVQLTSFGFKYGLPMDAELVFDMRFIKNPFYIDDLRDQTGLDKPVQDYINDQSGVQEFLTSWVDSVCTALPMFLEEGKSRVNIAIGCTGGKHRSVCMTLALSDALKARFPMYNISINHREQHRWPEQTLKPSKASGNKN